MTLQSDFVIRQCPVSHIKTSERQLEIAWMGHPSAPAVIFDLPASKYRLFASMGYALAGQHFSNFEEVGKWLNEYFAAKQKQFFSGDVFITYLIDGQNM